MYNIVINIIAWIAIIWFITLMFWNLVLYVWFKVTCDCKYICVTRDCYITETEFSEWILIPTIKLHLNGDYKSFYISWLKLTYIMEYHLKTEKQEDEEAEIRRQLRDKEKER